MHQPNARKLYTRVSTFTTTIYCHSLHVVSHPLSNLLIGQSSFSLSSVDQVAGLIQLKAFLVATAAMCNDSIRAESLQRSSEDTAQPDCEGSEKEEVERSYKENSAGNAQAAVDEFMKKMDFLQREGDLAYIVPKGIVHAGFQQSSPLSQHGNFG